jgi:NAD(P)-dependent dehydrogenase (short-subunit alcohol dehydrogenase family)/pimeloyl-ACP methyl ester carboxylesterase
VAAPAGRRAVRGAGIELAVVEGGDRDRPTIVFVHGYPDTKELWDDVLAGLGDRFHLVAYDVRGAGGSQAPRGPAAYGFERLAADLDAVVSELAPRSSFHLVGHDWGGIQGWEFATSERFDGRLQSFTTIAGPSLDQVSAAAGGALRRGRLLDWLGRVRRSWYVLALCIPGGPTLAWRGALAGGRWRWWLRTVERLPVGGGYPLASMAADGLHGANLYRRNLPPRILRPRRPAPARVPVQVIVPSGDHFISPDYYEAADRATPAGLRRRTVAGSHWSPRARPELLARWIGEFVSDVEAGRSLDAERPWVRGGGVEELRDRLALVTGAGSGIGRASALALAAHGARVLLVDRDGAAVAETARSIPGAAWFTCDVSDPEAMERLAAEVTGEHGVPQIVLNNAGIGVAGPFMETPLEDWRRVLDINLMGVVHGSRLFGRAMIERGLGGQIVNTASAAAFQPTKDLPAYATSKSAVLMLSECLRAELGPSGIGVTAVCPGIVATNITRTTQYVGRLAAEQDRLRDQVTSIYQRRNYTPERVAAEIVRAIATDRPVAAITPEAKAVHLLSRFAPGLLRRLAAIDALPS